MRSVPGTAGVSPGEARSAQGYDEAHTPLRLMILVICCSVNLLRPAANVCALRASAGETPAVPGTDLIGPRVESLYSLDEVIDFLLETTIKACRSLVVLSLSRKPCGPASVY
jgi:hypothetical protein